MVIKQIYAYLGFRKQPKKKGHSNSNKKKKLEKSTKSSF